MRNDRRPPASALTQPANEESGRMSFFLSFLPGERTRILRQTAGRPAEASIAGGMVLNPIGREGRKNGRRVNNVWEVVATGSVTARTSERVRERNWTYARCKEGRRKSDLSYPESVRSLTRSFRRRLSFVLYTASAFLAEKAIWDLGLKEGGAYNMRHRCTMLQ